MDIDNKKIELALSRLFCLTFPIHKVTNTVIGPNGNDLSVFFSLIDRMFKCFVKHHNRVCTQAALCALGDCDCRKVCRIFKPKGIPLPLDCEDDICDCPTNCEKHCGNIEDCAILVNSGIFSAQDCKIIEQHHQGIMEPNWKSTRAAIGRRIRRAMLRLFGIMITYPGLIIKSLNDLTTNNPEMTKRLINARAIEDIPAKRYIQTTKNLIFNNGFILLAGESLPADSGNQPEASIIAAQYSQHTVYKPLSLTIYHASIKYPWLLSFSTFLDILKIDKYEFARKCEDIRPDISFILGIPPFDGNESGEDADNETDREDSGTDDKTSGFTAKRRCP